MLTAVLTDIHGNREALDACLAHARRQGAQRIVLLGDLVGYGADPAYVVDVCRKLQDEGAIVLLGNHDEAVFASKSGMNEYARAAIEWTRGKLDVAQKKFLEDLPRTHREGDVLYVHSDASNPREWIYVTSPVEAERSIRATDALATFCGHVHRPQLYNLAPGRQASLFTPTTSTPVPLISSRRWLAVLGAVGQPRDEDPRAAYAIYDAERRTVAYHRVAYDIERAAQKIKNARLPAILSARLFVGR
jgi:diadenosine tetraphosphatase ApaH/serine/threonine PP2A family protein phosphatase